MSDETGALTERARQLEEENALLRSMQSPSGDEGALRAENALLRGELDLVRSAARPPRGAPGPDELPQTVEEFNALPSDQRQEVAYRMTRQQRDALIGRTDTRRTRDDYL